MQERRFALGCAIGVLILGSVSFLVLLEATSFANTRLSLENATLIHRWFSPNGHLPELWLTFLSRTWVPAFIIASGAFIFPHSRESFFSLRSAALTVATVISIAAISALAIAAPDTLSSYIQSPFSAAPVSIATLWMLIVSWQAANKAEMPALVCFGLPAIAIWTLSELLLTHKLINIIERSFVDQENGGVLAAAYSRLDHPWSAIGALIGTLFLVLGIVRSRERLQKMCLLALAIWVGSRGSIDAVEYYAAWRYIKRLVGIESLLSIGHTTLVFELIATVTTSVLAIVAIVTIARDTESRGRRVAFISFISLAALSATLVIDVSRLQGVVEVTASQALEEVLKKTATRPLSTSRVGGRIRSNFAVLHKNGTITVVEGTRRWRVENGGDLPIPKGGVVLFIDERVSIGMLNRLSMRLPAEYPMLLGRINSHLDYGSTTQRFETAASAVLTASAQWLCSSSFIDSKKTLILEPIWRDKQTYNLQELPSELSVRHIPHDGILVAKNTRKAAVSENVIKKSVDIRSHAWTLVSWGW